MRPPLLIATALFAAGAATGAGGAWWWLTSPKTYQGVARVIDGDTLPLDRRTVRLVGIDAPELPKGCRRLAPLSNCREPAADALSARVDGTPVVCTEVGRDRFGRTLGICHDRTGTELNGWLIDQCLVGSPPNPKHRDPRYEAMMAARACATPVAK